MTPNPSSALNVLERTELMELRRKVRQIETERNILAGLLSASRTRPWHTSCQATDT
jgi:hypothetical protein